MRTILTVILGISVLLGCVANTWAENASQVKTLERVTQRLVAPPFLPVHEQVAQGPPRVVQVRMVIEEKRMKISSVPATS